VAKNNVFLASRIWLSLYSKAHPPYTGYHIDIIENIGVSHNVTVFFLLNIYVPTLHGYKLNIATEYSSNSYTVKVKMWCITCE